MSGTRGRIRRHLKRGSVRYITQTELKVAQYETDSFKKMLQNTTKFSSPHFQIHTEVSIEMEKFILELANIFLRAITSEKCRSS